MKISLEAWSKVATYPSLFSHRGKVKKCTEKLKCVGKVKRFRGKIIKCSADFPEESHSVGGLKIIWLNADLLIFPYLSSLARILCWLTRNHTIILHIFTSGHFFSRPYDRHCGKQSFSTKLPLYSALAAASRFQNAVFSENFPLLFLRKCTIL